MKRTHGVFIHTDDLVWETWHPSHIETRGKVFWKTLVSGDKTSSDSLTMGLAELPPSHHLKVHRHAHAEVYFILDGEGVMRVGEEERAAPAGTAIYIPGNALHGIRNESDAPVHWIYVFPADSFADVVYEFDVEDVDAAG